MKIQDASQLSQHFKVGDILYGCAYTYGGQASISGNATMKQLPIQGMLSPCRYEKEYEANKNATYVNYFIPLNRKGVPAWQKAIKVYALSYATTELECQELYNSFVEANIKIHKAEIRKLKRDLIRIPVKTVVD